MGYLRLEAALPSTIFTHTRACLLLLLTLALCVHHGCGLQTNLKGAQATLPCLLQSANQRHDAALLTRYARNECNALLFVGGLNVVQLVGGTQQQQQNDYNCQGSQLASWGRPRGGHSTSQHSTRRCGACSSRKHVAASPPLSSHYVFHGCKQKSAARKDAKSALELMQLQLQAASDAISSSGAASTTSGDGAAAGAAAASSASSAAQPTTTQPSAAKPIFRSIPITDTQPHR